MLPRSVLIGGFAFVNLAAGFGCQWIVLQRLGVGESTDALFASFTLPQMILTLVSGPLANVMIPMLSGVPGDVARDRASAAALGITALAAPPILALYGLAPGWAPLTVPGFSADAHELLVRLVRVQLLGLLASAYFGVAWASAQARQRFVLSEASAAGVSVTALAVLLARADALGIIGVAWVFAVRNAARAVVLLPISSIRVPRRLRGVGLGEMVKRSLPLVGSGLYQKSETLFDQFLASLAPPGALSLYNLALSLQMAGVGIVNRAAFAPVVPQLGALANRGAFRDMAGLVKTNLRRAIALGAAVVVGAALLGRPVLSVLIGHGGVTDANVLELWTYTVGLSGLLGGLSAGLVLSGAMYALGETRVVSLTAMLAFTLGLGLKLAGFYAAGVVGLAVGTSGYVLLAAALTGAVLRRALRSRMG